METAGVRVDNVGDRPRIVGREAKKKETLHNMFIPLLMSKR